MNEPLMTSKQMDGLSDVDQAKRAIRYMLNRIVSDPSIGWYCGYGTQAFSLLTEAYATLQKCDIRQTRELFMPLHPKDPKED